MSPPAQPVEPDASNAYSPSSNHGGVSRLAVSLPICGSTLKHSHMRGDVKHKQRSCGLLFRLMLGRVWNMVRFPPPYQGPILRGRIDGIAYLFGWLATFAHVLLWVVVLVLGLHSPWKTVSTLASVIATLLLLTIVIVIHRRMGHGDKLPRSVVWQWWLGPWDPVGRLVWLPVRLGEAVHVVVTG